MTPLLFVLATQARRPVHPAPARPLTASQETAPVTAREAREAFGKLISLYGKVTDLKLGAPTIPAADRPTTRYEVIAEMGRVYREAAPAIRFTPAAIRYDASKFVVDASSGAALRKLVARGFVGPVGPLATGPKPSLTVKQFGDALGFFSARLAQVSHLPSPLWTPMLKVD